MRLFPVLIILAFGASSCASVSFDRTSSSNYPEQGVDCKFDVLTIKPSFDFDEIGILSFVDLGLDDCFNNIQKIKEESTKDVCSSGGTAVLIWGAKDNGCYTKATVIRKK